jgi:hypothetical protein
VQAIFRGQTAPPTSEVFAGVEDEETSILSSERPTDHHVTLSCRQVTVPNAVILLATGLRNVAEVTNPQGFAFLKESIVLRCYGAVIPDERTENN